jgi:hypothetical protein
MSLLQPIKKLSKTLLTRLVNKPGFYHPGQNYIPQRHDGEQEPIQRGKLGKTGRRNQG